jgi:hypothetical protein
LLRRRPVLVPRRGVLGGERRREPFGESALRFADLTGLALEVTTSSPLSRWITTAGFSAMLRARRVRGLPSK